MSMTGYLDNLYKILRNKKSISSTSPLSLVFPQLSPNSPKFPPKPPGNCSQLHPVAPTRKITFYL